MTKLQAYRLKAPAHEHPAGTICYRCQKYDYGCANDDTRMLGRKHVSMTLDPEGDYPFFTAAEDDLEPVEAHHD
jgi:hypothetical protein